MKALIKSLIFMCVVLVQTSIGCPTCVGRLDANKPAFFSDEFYKPREKTKPVSNTKQTEHKKAKKNNS